ncbi:MAG: shikimate kinase AroK [Gammaproteobacteria bacterium]|nr:shikimate kinase AroK [Gammaproteobacteria bacterium]
MNMPGNIFLIGPMGAGKSTIGRHLAGMTRKTFLDADKELESRTGASIPLIFEIEGEDGFRKRETGIIDELTRLKDLVLATGGGAVLAEDNRRMLHSRGTVVYLAASIDTLVERTRHDKNRPLLQNTDRRKKFEELMAVRDPLYRQEADYIIDTDNRSPQSVAREIVKQLEQGADS